MRLGQELNDQKAIALAYSDLRNLFWKQSKLKQELVYGLKSEAIFRKRAINDLNYDFTHYVIGNNHLALTDYPNALRYFKAATQMGCPFQIN